MNQPANQRCLVAAFHNDEHFRTAIEVLEKGHFTPDEVSIVIHAGDKTLYDLSAGKDTDSDASSSGITAAASTVAGGTLGVTLGTMTMVGPLLVAGPIFGMAAGAVGGGLLNAFQKWGVDREVAEDYTVTVRNGGKLLIITGDDIRLADAKQMLKTAGPDSLEIIPHE